MAERTIFGYTQTGERIALGTLEISDEDALAFLTGVAQGFQSGGGYFNVNSKIFNSKVWAGVEVFPGITTIER